MDTNTLEPVPDSLTVWLVKICVIPGPLIATVAPNRLLPRTVNWKAPPGIPKFGEISVSAGGFGE
jgi:hypothetical protein